MSNIQSLLGKKKDNFYLLELIPLAVKLYSSYRQEAKPLNKALYNSQEFYLLPIKQLEAQSKCI